MSHFGPSCLVDVFWDEVGTRTEDHMSMANAMRRKSEVSQGLSENMEPPNESFA